MRTSTLSTLALGAASLLVKGAFAKPVITDKVIVTEEIVVTAYPDGKLKTGEARAVGTKTIKGFVVITTVRPVSTIEDPTSTSSPAPKPTPVATTSSSAAAVFKEVAAPSSSAAPAPAPVAEAEVAPPVQSSSAAPAPAPTTTTQAPPPPAPTTTAQVVTSAAAPVASVISSVVAPVASSVPSSAPSTGGKRGIAYNDPSVLNAFKGTSASWAYNWAGSTSPIPSEFEFVPMLWGMDQHADNWEKWANEAIASGSKHLLGFNEPDHAEQANLDVGKAAAGYIQHMNPFAGQASLGSPAVTNGGAPMGLDWLSRFFDACAGNCHVDFVCLHWYNGGDANAFKEYMTNAHQIAGGRKIWITEFEAPGNDQAWLAEVLPWLDSTDFIERYSYFMASEGSLIAGGALSTLGQAYVS